MNRAGQMLALLRAVLAAILVIYAATSADLAPLELPGEAKGSITGARFAHPGSVPETNWIAGRGDHGTPDLEPGHDASALFDAVQVVSGPEGTGSSIPFLAGDPHPFADDQPRARAPPGIHA